MSLADFSINGDLTSQGFDGTIGQTLTFALRTSPVNGIRTWRLQVFSVSTFDSGQKIAQNPPRASKSAPTLTLVGATSGQDVAPTTLSGSITTTLPGTKLHSWIVRSVVNGGVDANGHADPSLIRERIVSIRDDFNNRAPVPTETTQYEDTGWAGAIRDFLSSLGSVSAVSSVFGRTGAIISVAGDYDSDQVDNLSGVSGVSVSDALDSLQTDVDAIVGLRLLQTLSTSNGDFPVGTTTWTTAGQVPAGEWFRLFTDGGGGGGASGGSNPSSQTVQGGSSGGGGAKHPPRWVRRAEIIAALPVAIITGAKGTKGAAVTGTVQAGGNNGTAGGDSRIGPFTYAAGGGGGKAPAAGNNSVLQGGTGGGIGGPGALGVTGSAADGVGGLPGQSIADADGYGGSGTTRPVGSPAASTGNPSAWGGASGGGTNTTPGSPSGAGGQAAYGGGGGGGGGSCAATGTGAAGADGGSSGARPMATTGSGGAAGAGNGGNGTNGADAADPRLSSGKGGGGGGGKRGTTPVTAGNGGNGGFPGGGGGGGGAAEVQPGAGTMTSGAGGDGGTGSNIIECYGA